MTQVKTVDKTEQEKINVLSLFDGISCGHIALERAGIEVENYFASEIEPSPIKVTQANYPNTKQLGSVLNVKGADLPKIDLLIGGSPCQGFSFAGKQLNFDDPRSKLFFEFVRLKNELNPKYFLLENVKMKKEYQDIICSTKYSLSLCFTKRCFLCHYFIITPIHYILITIVWYQ